MSLELELLAPDLDWELAERIQEATSRDGLVRVHVMPRRRWLRPRPPTLWMDDEFHDEVSVLDDQAGWEEAEFTLHPLGREALARSLLVLGELLDPGWSFRACWTGDAVEREVELAARDLADLAKRSALTRTTRYRVQARTDSSAEADA